MNTPSPTAAEREATIAEQVAAAWGAGRDAYELLEEARRQGLDVRCIKVAAQSSRRRDKSLARGQLKPAGPMPEKRVAQIRGVTWTEGDVKTAAVKRAAKRRRSRKAT